tara:strand:- start:1343 stop:2113 length:771 start_codon:yes stop_codon:yes gene_type:complete
MNLYVYLQGGLGNQMFQYAAGVSALKEYPQFSNLKLDASFYNDQERKVVVNGMTGRGYDLDLLNIQYNEIEEAPEGATMLEGFFQNISEFENVIDDIKNQFKFSIKFSDQIEKLNQQIECEKNSVSIHVRRGDFINNPAAYSYNEQMDHNYYEKAMSILENSYNDLTYYVFSEDIEWCKKNIKSKHRIVFVGNEYSGDRDSGHLYLMQSCKNHIIANSTYSWWGAFLSDSNIVIGPKKWNKSQNGSDIMLDNWIKI